MRKICSLICVVIFAVAGNAQQVYNLNKVVKDGLSFTAYAGDKALPISPFLYKRLKAEPAAYVLIDYVGENGSARTLAHRSKVSYAVLSVDSVGLDDQDVAEVYLSDVNGKRSVYKSQNDEWLKVLKGQHVERWLVDGETKVLSHYRTVPRETPLTNDVPYEDAPLVAQVTPTTTFTPATQPVAATVTTTQPVTPANNTATRPTLLRR